MSGNAVVVVQTGSANMASVMAALERAGRPVRIAGGAADILWADHLVLPGVGALGAAMRELRARDLVEVLRERVCRGRPTLAICLGLQLLCQGSEESPGVSGLGLLPVRAKRFPATVRVPQLGWNRVVPGAACRLLQPGHAYFANAYRLEQAPPGWAAATTEHGGRFVSALEKDALLACQFHPELSGAWGARLLQRWLGPGGEPC
jgi:imidazole glycerol phosphate synthase glutamine amidotransferase subunit